MSATDISGVIVVVGALVLTGAAVRALAGIGLCAVRARRDAKNGGLPG